jgi:spoIIIJ-associated protein
MEWVETTGRTVEAALDAALDELGVDEAEVEYEVIEQPRGGLFGRLGGSEARIRARVKPVSREKPGERQRRNRRSGSGQSRGGGSRPGGSGNPARQGTPRDRVPAGGSGGPSGAAGEDTDGQGSGEGAGGGPARRRRRRGGRGRRTGSGGPNSSTTIGPEAGERTDTSKGSPVETIEPEVTIEEQAEAAEAFTRGLVDAFDLGAEVTTVIVDDGVLVDVTGSELGLLVGPRGVTLNAIEELVRTVVQRQTDGHGVRINVDVGGYRAKRREALADFTRGIAARVLENDRPQALEPMSASDRKVVHDTVAEIDGVATESEGEEPRRRVVLIPAGVSGEPS